LPAHPFSVFFLHGQIGDKAFPRDPLLFDLGAIIEAAEAKEFGMVHGSGFLGGPVLEERTLELANDLNCCEFPQQLDACEALLTGLTA